MRLPTKRHLSNVHLWLPTKHMMGSCGSLVNLILFTRSPSAKCSPKWASTPQRLPRVFSTTPSRTPRLPATTSSVTSAMRSSSLLKASPNSAAYATAAQTATTNHCAVFLSPPRAIFVFLSLSSSTASITCAPSSMLPKKSSSVLRRKPSQSTCRLPTVSVLAVCVKSLKTLRFPTSILTTTSVSLPLPENTASTTKPCSKSVARRSSVASANSPLQTSARPAV